MGVRVQGCAVDQQLTSGIYRWADQRISRHLGIDRSTVKLRRAALEACGSIPRIPVSERERGHLLGTERGVIQPTAVDPTIKTTFNDLTRSRNYGQRHSPRGAE